MFLVYWFIWMGKLGTGGMGRMGIGRDESPNEWKSRGGEWKSREDAMS